MKGHWYIGGTRAQVGKTFISLGLAHHAASLHPTGAWKPVDVDRIKTDIEEELYDGTKLYEAASMQIHPSASTPFLLSENLPPLLAAEREGIRLRNQTLDRYFQHLSSQFDCVITEGARGLHIPLTETRSELEWIHHWKPQILWVCSVGPEELSLALLQIKTLQQAQLSIQGIILNNHQASTHGDLIRYQWITLEEATGIPVIGLIPFLPSPQPETIHSLLKKHLKCDFFSI